MCEAEWILFVVVQILDLAGRVKGGSDDDAPPEPEQLLDQSMDASIRSVSSDSDDFDHALNDDKNDLLAHKKGKSGIAKTKSRCATLCCITDYLHYERAEVVTVRDILVSGEPDMLVRLFIQTKADNHEIHNQTLKEYMDEKLRWLKAHNLDWIVSGTIRDYAEWPSPRDEKSQKKSKEAKVRIFMGPTSTSSTSGSAESPWTPESVKSRAPPPPSSRFDDYEHSGKDAAEETLIKQQHTSMTMLYNRYLRPSYVSLHVLDMEIVKLERMIYNRKEIQSKVLFFVLGLAWSPFSWWLLDYNDIDEVVVHWRDGSS